jgi:hypothetical protein
LLFPFFLFSILCDFQNIFSFLLPTFPFFIIIFFVVLKEVFSVSLCSFPSPQNEYDALVLESHTMKQHLETVRQELAHALYQYDAAWFVLVASRLCSFPYLYDPSPFLVFHPTVVSSRDLSRREMPPEG